MQQPGTGFDMESTMAMGNILQGSPALFWIFVVTEFIILVSYLAIPFMLLRFIPPSKDLAFKKAFRLFTTFIIACGFTQYFDIWLLWHPDYWFSALAHVVTASLALISAYLLWRIVPRVLGHPTNRELKRTVQERTHSLNRMTSFYAVLSQGNSAMIHADNQQNLLESICEVILEYSGFKLAWVGQEAPDRSVVPIVARGSASDYLINLHLSTRSDLPEGQGPTGTAIRENRIVVVNNFQTSGLTRLWHDAALQHGIFSSISLPIITPDFRGALMVYADTEDFFETEIVGLLKGLCDNISYALERLHLATLKESQEMELRLADRVFASSSEAMMITDTNNNIIRVNQAFCDVTGYWEEEVLGKNPRMLKSGKHDATFYRIIWLHLLLQGSWQGEIWNRRKNGEVFPDWVSINQIKNANGKVTHHFAIFSDLLQKKAVEELNHLKHYDPLTDLPNRTLLEDRVERAIGHARQYDRFVGLMFMNLDHFHTVNDTFGHMAGDKMLVITAQRLIKAIPANASVTRLSADTFVIVLPDLNTSAEINRIAEIINQQVYQPFMLDNQQVQLSACMGISVFPLDGNDVTALMQHADIALSDAKQSGSRNNFHFYSASMNEHARKLVTMSAELRNAIEHGGLVLHYQPQVDIASGEIVGAEALIRLKDAKGVLTSPTEFISVAEETGLILPMGEWALREACRQMKQWHDTTHTALVIAVNLSPLQFHQSSLMHMVRDALEQSGLLPQYLELEFTESAIIRNVGDTIPIMENLREMGIHLSIDDFGTGYSSLAYLKRFPVDKLKIDQSFISNISQNPSDAAIVQAIIALSRTLGMSTIAEGVETEAQLGYLRSVHCKEIQGYLYSPPLPAEEFAKLLLRGKRLSNNEAEKTLLLVDDEENVLMSLKRILRREGYKILTASSAEEALELLAQNPVQVILTDQRMPGMTGVELLRRVKTMYPNVIRIILSGYTEVATLTDAINKGEIYQFITKPWENEALAALLREAFIRYEMLTRNQQ